MQVACPKCERLLDYSGDRPRLCAYCGQSLGDSSDAEMLATLKSNLTFPPIRNPILAEFGRRSNRMHRTSAMAIAGAVVEGTPSQGFRDAWEFVDWAEKSRPDLDLRHVSRKGMGN